MPSVIGKISVAKTRISCDLNNDFCRYYKYLIEKSFPNLVGGLFIPRHGCHITVARSELHVIDLGIAKWFDGEVIPLEYDPSSVYIGGYKKGFIGFYLPIFSNRLEKIRKTVSRIKRGQREGSFHISLCSTKHVAQNCL